MSYDVTLHFPAFATLLMLTNMLASKNLKPQKTILTTSQICLRTQPSVMIWDLPVMNWSLPISQD